TWSVADEAASGTLGGGLGLALGVIPMMARVGMDTHLGTFSLCALIAGVAGATGALAGVVRARDQLRRAENHAQQTRVHALERSLSLKESSGSGAGANLEGTVAAGQYRFLQGMGA